MQKLIIASLCLAVTLALPYDVVQDDQGQHYYMVPLSRAKRQETVWDINKDPGKVHVHHSGTIYNDGDHKLDGKVYATQNVINPRDPTVVGGKLAYTHNSGSGVNLQAVNRHGVGTKVGAEANYNLYRNGPFHLDLTGSYGRTFGEGGHRTTHPQYSTDLIGTVDF